jgi:hypothetical protein
MREVGFHLIPTLIETIGTMDEELEGFHHCLVRYIRGLFELTKRDHQRVIAKEVVLKNTGGVEFVAEVKRHTTREL